MTEGSTAPAMLGGLELARRYFAEAVEPIVAAVAPHLSYAAALIGDGSDVLGFDDAVSTDHDWGPRAVLFLPDEDFPERAAAIVSALDQRLPPLFAGWTTDFPDPDRPVGLSLEERCAGSANHAVEVHSLGSWLERQIGLDASARAPSPREWDALDEQRLLSVTSGAVFRDDLGALATVRARLAFLPEDVRLAKMARLWSAAAAELPFVGRAGHVGDDLGSRILCARLAEQAMRLCFLIDRRYAPYSKWLGTAWARLPSASSCAADLHRALAATGWRERQEAVSAAFAAVGQRQVDESVPGAVAPVLSPYFSRPYLVVNADEIAAGLRSAIVAPAMLKEEERCT